ncbi:hypothetical protein F7231_00720 [Fibrella aestuarina]|uniref:Tetratricopeptide repeat protein n=1 Tax=Fibrivirga algicola TaxID=2950420 RepID=A0ABX0Q9C1_9BACT|nr:hypothetical protein [Fibrivirga algicola]
MLFEISKPDRDETVLNDYLRHDNQHTEATMLLTYLNLWQGNGQAARDRSSKLLRWYPDNVQIQELAETVH